MCFVFLCLVSSLWAGDSFTWNTTSILSEPGETTMPTAYVASNAVDGSVAIWSIYDESGKWTVATAFSANDGKNWFDPVTPITVTPSATINPIAKVALNDNNVAISVFVSTDGHGIQEAYSSDGGQNWFTQSLISSPTSTFTNPEIAMQGENLAIACWETSDGAIQTTYSTDGGATWSLASTLVASNAHNPQVAIDLYSEACLVYESTAESTAGQILGYTSEDGGQTWTASSTAISSNSPSTNPQIVLNDLSMVIAIWKRTVSGKTVIESAYSLDEGGNWSTPQIISDPLKNSLNANVSMDINGNAVVVWQSVEDGNNVIQYVSSSDNGYSFSTPYSLTSSLEDNVSPVVSINDDDEVAAIVYVNNTQNEIIACSSTDAGATFSTPHVIAYSSDGVSNPSVCVNDNDFADVVWSVDTDSTYTVETLYGNFFSVSLTQGKTKLLFQTDFVNHITCGSTPDVTLFRVYQDEDLTDMIYEGADPDFYDHGQIKGEEKTYYVTWVDEDGEESTSLDISTPSP